MSDSTDTPVEGGAQQPVNQAAGERAPADPSLSDLATDATTKAYVKFLTACFALVGAAAGLGVLFVGFVGGAPLSSSLFDMASVASVNLDPTLNQLYVNRLAYQVLNAAPLVAGVLGVGGGLYVASNLDGSDRHTYVAAGLGGGVGAFALVVVVGLLGSFAISQVPIPESAQNAAALAGSSQLSQAGSSGAISAVYIGGTSLAFDKLAFNAVAIGVGVGLMSAAAAYVSRELSPA